jgi:hypothetical protein
LAIFWGGSPCNNVLKTFRTVWCILSHTALDCGFFAVVHTSLMWQFCNSVWKLSPVYFYLQSVPIYFLLALCPHIFCIGNLSPYIFYWQSVPIYCLLAKCPCFLFIGKVSPYFVYWQDVHIFCLLARFPHIFFILGIFLIVKHSSHTVFFFVGMSAHIPSVSVFWNPRTVAMFHTIPEQGKIPTSKPSIPEQHGFNSFNPIFNP